MVVTGESTGRRFALVTLLALTMAAGTFIIPAVGVLASSVRQDLGLELWQVGLLVTGSPLVGALLAPSLGRVTDRVGGKTSMVATLGLGALTLALFAASPTFLILVGAALLTGVSQGWANPATNKVISRHYPPGGRGVVIGIKQSGVQFGSFLAGLALPAAALALGWRGALLAASTIPLLGTLLATIFVPNRSAGAAAGRPWRTPSPPRRGPFPRHLRLSAGTHRQRHHRLHGALRRGRARAVAGDRRRGRRRCWAGGRSGTGGVGRSRRRSRSAHRNPRAARSRSGPSPDCSWSAPPRSIRGSCGRQR